MRMGERELIRYPYDQHDRAQIQIFRLIFYPLNMYQVMFG